MKYKFYWHIHHTILFEALTEPIENRIKYIKENKPKNEIKLRLKLLKPVKGKLPKEVVEAYKARDEAYKAWDEAHKAWDEAYNKAWDEAYKAWDEADKARVEAYKARDEATEKYKDKIEALHRVECKNCPWDGRTIFSSLKE